MSEAMATPDLTDPLLMSVLKRQLHNAGGWISFDRFMALALYTPGLPKTPKPRTFQFLYIFRYLFKFRLVKR